MEIFLDGISFLNADLLFFQFYFTNHLLVRKRQLIAHAHVKLYQIYSIQIITNLHYLTSGTAFFTLNICLLSL